MTSIDPHLRFRKAREVLACRRRKRRGAAANGTNTRLSFPTQTGFNYQVQYKTNLTDANWIPVGAIVPGNDATQSIDVPASGNSGFYRVQLE
jgi:hypothetical protein